jgi:catechol 2,3-dioxygenase-like lactoylglutathione lyase family enzyme
MIVGAHSIIFSKDPEADRRFFRDVLRFPNVDVGDGWLIFALPPSEVAVHPADEGGRHELFLMCDDIEALIEDMARHGVPCEPVQEQDWGRLTYITLPGGGNLGIYQPRHARPNLMRAAYAPTHSSS